MFSPKKDLPPYSLGKLIDWKLKQVQIALWYFFGVNSLLAREIN
ncbi:hypothetical protein PL10110_260020 [Planktothrix agardhii]|nr:hypothetical protein PL10110_260020 [Planktothrix agardhii]